MDRVTLNRQQLYKLVWSESLLSLSKKYKISDVGLRKICRRMNVPVPKMGYWQRVKVGRSVLMTSLPRDYKGKDEMTLIIRTMDSEGNVVQTQSLKERIKEIESDPKLPLKVAEKLTNPCDLVIAARDKLLYRSNYQNFYRHVSGNVDKGYLSIEVSQLNISRALRIFDAVIKLFRARGHEIVAKYFDTYAIIGGESFKIALKEKNSMVKDEKTGERKSKPTGKLVFRYLNYNDKSWTDNKQSLEEQLSHILAYFELEAERLKIERLRYEEESRKREERERLLREEKERQERELARFNDLIKQANKWHQTNILRDYISAVKANAIEKNMLTEELSEWLEWAKRKVEDYDPLNTNNK